jgi:hypothetical protein
VTGRRTERVSAGRGGQARRRGRRGPAHVGVRSPPTVSAAARGGRRTPGPWRR